MKDIIVKVKIYNEDEEDLFDLIEKNSIDYEIIEIYKT